MKIGFSFGKCLRDLVTGVVKFDDVIMVVSATLMRSEDAIQPVVDDYLRDPSRLYGLDPQACIDMAKKLYTSGKLHQPRIFGNYRAGVADKFLWMDLYPSALNDDPSVKEAWDQYKLILTLSLGEALPKEDEVQTMHFGNQAF
jgi:hypothetical protein